LSRSAPPRPLFQRPEHTFVGYFIGFTGYEYSPLCTARYKVLIEGHEITLDCHYPEQAASAKIEVGVRPEYLSLAQPDKKGLPVKIIKVDDVGRHKIVRVALNDHLFHVVISEISAMTGDEASLVFDTAHTNIYVNDHLIAGEKP